MANYLVNGESVAFPDSMSELEISAVISGFAPEPTQQDQARQFEANLTDQDKEAIRFNEELGQQRLAIQQQEAPAQSAILPRFTEAQAVGRGGLEQTLSTGADLLSLLGRTIASAPELFSDQEKSFVTDLAKTSGTGFVEDIIRSPELGAAALTAPVSIPLAAGRGLAGLSAVSAGEGLLGGAVTQAEKVGAGGQFDPAELITDVAVSAVTPAGLNLGGQLFKRAVNPLMTAAAVKLTDISEETLKKIGPRSGAKEVMAASDNARLVAGELVELAQNPYKYIDIDGRPLNEVISEGLELAPDIELKNVIDALKKSKFGVEKTIAGKKRTVGTPAIFENVTDPLTGITKQRNIRPDTRQVLTGKSSKVTEQAFTLQTEANKEIDKIIKTIKQFPHKTDAVTYKNIQRSIAEDIQFNKPWDDMLSEALGPVYTKMRGELREVAGPNYSKAMDKAFEVEVAQEKLKLLLGRNRETQEFRVEGFMNNLFGKNKSMQQEVLKGIDNVFEKDFTEKIGLKKMANELGPKGVAQIFNNIKTGARNTSIIAGGFMGGPLGAAAGIIPSSPYFASKGLRLGDLTQKGFEGLASPKSLKAAGTLSGLGFGARKAVGAPQTLTDLFQQEDQ